jgi:hypothetical protein
LIYPGGDVVHQSSGAEERRVVDSAPAATRIDFYASDAEGKAVSDWYAARLLASGWRPVDMIGTSIAKAQWSYKRGDRELFLIELLEPRLFPADAPHLGMQHFWVTYWVFPRGSPHV